MRKFGSNLIAATVFATGLFGGSAFAETKTAIFAGGCFWCIEKDFEHVEGVIDVQSGYAGGTSTNPTYKNHIADGHLEVVQIKYDSTKTDYSTLLDSFWHTVDVTDDGGQFCDRGSSYTTAVFALDDMQRDLATKSKQALEDSKVLSKPVVTPIRGSAVFYAAEGYHQDYYKKNPKRYGYYRWACKRNATVKALWGDSAYMGVSGDH